MNYIPAPADEGEIPLSPIDDADENRRQQITMEDAAYQRRLLHERALPIDTGKADLRRPGSPPPAPPSSKVLAGLIVKYVEALSAGHLEQAEEVAGQLSRQKSAAMNLLDELMGEDLSAYGLPILPRPVLMGFLKQLRSKL